MSAETKQRRPRISLLSLLLLTALIATSTTTWRLWQRVGPLEAEVRQLRRDAGVLTVEDPERLYAIGVETYVTTAWKWRIAVPAGRRFVVRVAASDVPIPGSGLPGDDPNAAAVPAALAELEINRQNAAAAEVEVTLAAEKTLDGGVRWNLREGWVTTYVPVPEDADAWLRGPYAGSKGGGRVGIQLEETPGRPLVLLLRRVFYQNGQMNTPNVEPTGDGIMAWIEEIDR